MRNKLAGMLDALEAKDALIASLTAYVRQLEAYQERPSYSAPYDPSKDPTRAGGNGGY